MEYFSNYFRIVFQALLLTCSSTNVSDLPAVVGVDVSETNLYQVYYHLWKHILQPGFLLQNIHLPM